MLENNLKGRSTAAMLALMTALGCGGGEGGGGQPAGGGGAAAPAANPVDAATAGSVSGMVTFTGTPAADVPIDLTEEDVCAAKHQTPPVTRSAIVGGDGGLGNVFVHVTSGPGTTLQFPTSTDQEVLDQNGCIYEPHVIALQIGQELAVRNSDAVLHNINATPSANRPFNRSQPQAGMEFTTSFAAAEVMIPVRCDVHGWMEAFVGVTTHPYHAVTTESGGFSIDNIPPGDYQIEAWHERYGTVTQSVTVPPSGQAEVNLEFNESMAGNPVPTTTPLIVDHHNGRLRRAGQ